MKNYSLYTERYTDQLSPKAQQIIAQLPDDVSNPITDATCDITNKDEYSMPVREQRAVERGRVRRAVPELDPLSDDELDVVIKAACAVAAHDRSVSQLEKGDELPINTMKIKFGGGKPARWLACDMSFLHPDEMDEGIMRLKRVNIHARQLPGHVDPTDDEVRWILAWVEIGEQWNAPDDFMQFVSTFLYDIAGVYEWSEVNDAQLARWLASTDLSQDLGA